MTPDSHSSFEVLLREAAELRVPASSAVVLPEPGTVLQDKYRLEEKLGQGGMGAVFRATNVETGKQVAIKWLLGRSPQAAQRFLREACVTAKIDHPNVVNVFDYGAHQDGRYLVMELLRGESLGARIQRQPLTASELVEIMIPVLRGLGAVHRAGVIHRDLKPDNVFLCVGPDGAARPPKVLDFGISKLHEPLPLDERLTGQGSGLGTVAYMSPQQLADATNVDERADIYGAGVTMYEALTGCRPFSAKNNNALVLAIATQRPRPIAALVPDVPRALERIVMRAMARQPRERQPDVQTLIDELQALSSDALAPGAPRGSHGPGPLSRWTWAMGLSVPLSVAIWFAVHPPERAAQPRSLPVALAAVGPQVASTVEPKSAPEPAPSGEGISRPANVPPHDDGALLHGSRVRRPAAAPLAKPTKAKGQAQQMPVLVESPAGPLKLSHF